MAQRRSVRTRTRSATREVMPRAARSLLVDRANLARALGFTTFNGKRNVAEALGYQQQLTAADYWERFRRNGLAKRIVQTYPVATWRGGMTLVEDEDPDVITPFEAAWTEMNERLGVLGRFKRSDILSGVGQYSLLLIGAAGTTSLEAELQRVSKPEDIIYLSVFSELDAVIERFDEDPKSPRYGLPMFYQVGRMLPSVNTSGGRPQRTGRQRVHWSRVIHVADGLLEDDVYAPPKLECVWDRLDDLDKILGGGAEAFWRRAHQGYVVSLDKEMSPPPTPEEINKLEDAAEEFAHGFRRTVGARGIDFEALGSDVADFKNQADAIMSFISASTEIPKRVLMGSEMGELASSQDAKNFDTRVTDRRMDFAANVVVRQFAGRLIGVNALPEPESYDIWWPEIEALDEEQRANVVAKIAQANRMNGEPIMTTDEIRDAILNLPPIEADVDPVEEEMAVEEQAEETGLPVQAVRVLRTSKRWVGATRSIQFGGVRARSAVSRAAAKKKVPTRKQQSLSVVRPTGTSGVSAK